MAETISHNSSEVAGEGLSVRDVNAWYGESHVLFGVDFDVRPGQVVTLLGRNGAGKTTILRTIMGLLQRRTGSINFNGRELIGAATRKIARMGIGYVPEERGIFSTLTVEENLMLPPQIDRGGMSLDDIYRMFPNLQNRGNSQGTKLSGGEQQMLSIARILRTGAKFLLLDEPTEGLAPVIVDAIGETLKTLKQAGYTIVLVEQNFAFAATITDRHYIVEQGRVIDRIDRNDADASAEKIRRYLGV